MSKKYDLSTTNLKRTNAEIRDLITNTTIFEIDLSFCISDTFSSKNPDRHSVVMFDPRSRITHTADLSFSSISKPIHLCFNNDDNTSSSSNQAAGEDMIVRDKWSMNGFDFNVDLGPSMGKKAFCWKRTRDVDTGIMSKNLDWLHLKLVEAGGDNVLARFTHTFKYGSKRGEFEVLEYNGGERWETVVMLSGVAVLEYLRKVSGWSW